MCVLTLSEFGDAGDGRIVGFFRHSVILVEKWETKFLGMSAPPARSIHLQLRNFLGMFEPNLSSRRWTEILLCSYVGTCTMNAFEYDGQA